MCYSTKAYVYRCNLHYDSIFITRFYEFSAEFTGASYVGLSRVCAYDFVTNSFIPLCLPSGTNERLLSCCVAGPVCGLLQEKPRDAAIIILMGESENASMDYISAASRVGLSSLKFSWRPPEDARLWIRVPGGC